MSLARPAKALATRCLFCQPLPIRSRLASSIHQRRFASDDSSPKPNPFLEEYRRNNPEKGDAEAQIALRQQMTPGDIASSSIFEDDRRAARQAEKQEAETEEGQGAGKAPKTKRDPAMLDRVLNPDPAGLQRWQRKQVIKLVRKGGRYTKPQMIKRTEREHTVKSANFKTSIKKLGMLARQISGMQLDEAITQMRFSKKKVATEVMEQLEAARDEAIVMRGMGLGLSSTPDDKPVEIQLKSGKRHTVTDASEMYIDQAWVGRGPYGKLPDYRARGRVFMLRTPWTSLTVVLKEEKTRIREWNEREEKRKQATKTWVPLPDRPVQWQRQWYTF
ncbi:Hypothetical protein R9X50_00459500 [Acrodontium crateriforme]|uniref:Mitochondrial large ribosomal subunit n=1 Tax=Acrodontium crateriforme TaxID=150365 RepID=A0AAQ3M5R2_9PEZI|nr:Hypothetical protein R9X50_00459500 [Acrodontium crateriforme]